MDEYILIHYIKVTRRNISMNNEVVKMKDHKMNMTNEYFRYY